MIYFLLTRNDVKLFYVLIYTNKSSKNESVVKINIL